MMIGLIFRSVIWREVVCRSSNGSLQKKLQKADDPTVDYGLHQQQHSVPTPRFIKLH